MHGYFRRYCSEEFHSQTYILVLEITTCGLLKRVVYHWNWKPPKSILYRPDRLDFLLLLFIEGQGRNIAEDELLHLLAQLVAPAVFEFSCKHLLPGSGVLEGHMCGESMAEPSLQSAAANPGLADWPGRCGWLAAAGAELRCHSQALDGPRPMAVLAKAFCSVLCAKHKWNKPSTIMQVKKRRKEQVESLCGWSLYYRIGKLGIYEFTLLNSFPHWPVILQVKLIYKQINNTTCQIKIVCMLNSWLWLFL